MADQSRVIFLSDYQPYSHRLLAVDLIFHLDPKATRVTARLQMQRNPDRAGSDREGRPDLRLDGEGLRLIHAKIDGVAITPRLDATGLTIAGADLPEVFTLETLVENHPEANTALEGLYMSNGLYCTQCEAEGFRHITYYPDRPDVMAPFRVRIEADQPVLLSNGNPVDSGPGWAEWHDPWPKPAYLFALVAGDLVAHSAAFVTASGRDVALNIWVRPGDEDRCAHAMDSLIRAMRWDERVYGREYDLDVFNIVAVDDFNMGAMENKGLNIFNAKYVLASPATATDDDFADIEAIIAHEYFHNWTGNRITCRDWFQLCLKEGLTVFRDQQFSGDMRSRAVQRIEDVLTLRARQFREDGGPLAHPVRPESFIEINNFYTATVYEKGAEVIGMLKLLVGEADYARALTLYFDRHDGEAATIEDWLKVFEDTTGRDLNQFKRWYSQAGTPLLKATEDWQADVAGGTFTLTLEQVNPPTPDQPGKDPKLIPVAVGLLNPNGDEVRPTEVLELTRARQSFGFSGLATRPIASILRGFSAPVVVDHAVSSAERAFLLAHDTDPFNRWEAGRSLTKETLGRMITEAAAPDPDLLDGLARLTFDDGFEPAFRALALRLPGEDDMAATLSAAGQVPDPQKIHAARLELALALAQHLAKGLPGLEASLRSSGPYSPDAAASGKRALRLAALGLISRLDQGALARQAYAAAANMTDQTGALSALLVIGQGDAELSDFAARWQHERLVMDKWFALQVAFAAPEAIVALTSRLTGHPLFDWKNPNRFRSVLGPLSGNHAGFHVAGGGAYRLLADWLIRLDPLNPQTAARMSTAFETWPRYDADRQALICAELQRILAAPGLSRDLGEMAARMLG